VAEPDRCIFRFGRLMITADDFAIWQAYRNAAFMLYGTVAATETGEEWSRKIV
jgi:hypothetical protein